MLSVKICAQQTGLTHQTSNRSACCASPAAAQQMLCVIETPSQRPHVHGERAQHTLKSFIFWTPSCPSSSSFVSSHVCASQQRQVKLDYEVAWYHMQVLLFLDLPVYPC